jgi:hypothetical protein
MSDKPELGAAFRGSDVGHADRILDWQFKAAPHIIVDSVGKSLPRIPAKSCANLESTRFLKQLTRLSKA